MRRRSKLWMIRIALFCVSVTFIGVNLKRMNVLGGTYLKNYDIEDQRRLSKEDKGGSEKNRPTIHTFFHKIDPNKKGTGMSEKSDDALIAAWKEEWRAAGWNPVVLTLEDAKKHPRYDEFAKTLERVPLMGKGGKGLNILYNQLCYYRWMAMAAVGGGWMSDYDVFPLGPVSDHDLNTAWNKDFLPNDGTFTVHSVVPGSKGSGIPCLMSGNQKQWEDMSFRILDNGANHPKERMWTDMFALMDLRHENKEQQIYRWVDDVLPGQDVLLGKIWSQRDCEITKNKRAVHFSHDALVNGIIGEHDRNQKKNNNDEANWHKMNDRPNIVQRWHRMWKRICLNKQNFYPPTKIE